MGHLTTALRVNALLPVSNERDHNEVAIRLLLGAAYVSSMGHAATEILDTLKPARILLARLMTSLAH